MSAAGALERHYRVVGLDRERRERRPEPIISEDNRSAEKVAAAFEEVQQR